MRGDKIKFNKVWYAVYRTRLSVYVTGENNYTQVS